MAKERVIISSGASEEVLFLADRTCCVCNERGRAIQIHHLDENPANNEQDNLVVLCLLCHDDTHIRGGFGRKLNEKLVRKYRLEWHAALRARRAKAAGFLADKNPSDLPQIINPTQDGLTKKPQLVAFLNTLPLLRAELYRLAKSKWDSGITSDMKRGTYDVIEVLEGVLVTLSGWYPQGHFDHNEPKHFISSLIAGRFRWHRFQSEPLGGGTGGTIVGIYVAASVLTEVEGMVVEMARSLCTHLMEPDFDKWLSQWKKAESDD